MHGKSPHPFHRHVMRSPEGESFSKELHERNREPHRSSSYFSLHYAPRDADHSFLDDQRVFHSGPPLSSQPHRRQPLIYEQRLGTHLRKASGREKRRNVYTPHTFAPPPLSLASSSSACHCPCHDVCDSDCTGKDMPEPLPRLSFQSDYSHHPLFFSPLPIHSRAPRPHEHSLHSFPNSRERREPRTHGVEEVLFFVPPTLSNAPPHQHYHPRNQVKKSSSALDDSRAKKKKGRRPPLPSRFLSVPSSSSYDELAQDYRGPFPLSSEENETDRHGRSSSALNEESWPSTNVSSYEDEKEDAKNREKGERKVEDRVGGSPVQYTHRAMHTKREKIDETGEEKSRSMTYIVSREILPLSPLLSPLHPTSTERSFSSPSPRRIASSHSLRAPLNASFSSPRPLWSFTQEGREAFTNVDRTKTVEGAEEEEEEVYNVIHTTGDGNERTAPTWNLVGTYSVSTAEPLHQGNALSPLHTGWEEDHTLPPPSLELERSSSPSSPRAPPPLFSSSPSSTSALCISESFISSLTSLRVAEQSIERPIPVYPSEMESGDEPLPTQRVPIPSSVLSSVEMRQPSTGTTTQTTELPSSIPVFDEQARPYSLLRASPPSCASSITLGKENKEEETEMASENDKEEEVTLSETEKMLEGNTLPHEIHQEVAIFTQEIEAAYASVERKKRSPSVSSSCSSSVQQTLSVPPPVHSDSPMVSPMAASRFSSTSSSAPCSPSPAFASPSGTPAGTPSVDDCDEVKVQETKNEQEQGGVEDSDEEECELISYFTEKIGTSPGQTHAGVPTTTTTSSPPISTPNTTVTVTVVTPGRIRKPTPVPLCLHSETAFLLQDEVEEDTEKPEMEEVSIVKRKHVTFNEETILQNEKKSGRGKKRKTKKKGVQAISHSDIKLEEDVVTASSSACSCTTTNMTETTAILRHANTAVLRSPSPQVFLKPHLFKKTIRRHHPRHSSQKQAPPDSSKSLMNEPHVEETPVTGTPSPPLTSPTSHPTPPSPVTTPASRTPMPLSSTTTSTGDSSFRSPSTRPAVVVSSSVGRSLSSSSSSCRVTLQFSSTALPFTEKEGKKINRTEKENSKSDKEVATGRVNASVSQKQKEGAQNGKRGSSGTPEQAARVPFFAAVSAARVAECSPSARVERASGEVTQPPSMKSSRGSLPLPSRRHSSLFPSLLAEEMPAAGGHGKCVPKEKKPIAEEAAELPPPTSTPPTAPPPRSPSEGRASPAVLTVTTTSRSSSRGTSHSATISSGSTMRASFMVEIDALVKEKVFFPDRVPDAPEEGEKFIWHEEEISYAESHNDSTTGDGSSDLLSSSKIEAEKEKLQGFPHITSPLESLKGEREKNDEEEEDSTGSSSGTSFQTMATCTSGYLRANTIFINYQYLRYELKQELALRYFHRWVAFLESRKRHYRKKFY